VGSQTQENQNIKLLSMERLRVSPAILFPWKVSLCTPTKKKNNKTSKTMLTSQHSGDAFFKKIYTFLLLDTEVINKNKNGAIQRKSCVFIVTRQEKMCEQLQCKIIKSYITHAVSKVTSLFARSEGFPFVVLVVFFIYRSL